MSGGEHPDSLVRCVLAVAAVDELAEERVTEILHDLGNESHKQGVTGMVLCEGRDFLQVLEGPRDKIEEMYRHIALDKRQHRLVKLYDEPLDDREFAQMSMAYGIAGRDVFRSLKDNRAVYEARGPVKDLPDSRAKALMVQFAHGRWRRSRW